MKNNIRQLIDFEKLNALLEGFNKTTGFVTAILDLEGNVLSKSGWRQICTEFHRVNPDTSKKCTISDTELANKLAEGEKYYFYKCLNGLVDVAVPIIIDGEHIANLFSGQFFFEEPDVSFFKKQAEKYGFDEEKYLAALKKVPVVSEEKVKTAMDFLLDMTQLISETAFQTIVQAELKNNIFKAKERAEESEEKFKTIVENGSVLLTLTDDQGRIEFASPQCEKVIGWKIEDIIGVSKPDFIYPDDLLRVTAEREKVTSLHPIKEFEYRIFDKEKKIRWISHSAALIKKGDAFSVLSTITNITEQKQTEQELIKAKQKAEESEERYRALLAANPDIMFMLSKDGVFLDCNFGKPEEVLMPPEMFLHKHISEVMPKPIALDIIDKLNILFATNETQRYEYSLEIDGKLQYYEARIAKASENNSLSIIRNVTESKRAELALKESEERFQLLFNKAPLGYQSLDVNGCFIEVNQQWLDTLGYKREEVIGKWFGDFLTPMYQEGFRKRFPIFKAQGHIHSEFEMAHKNGSIRFIAFDGRIGNDINGEFKQTHCILQDITEIKKVQYKLLQSEAKFRSFFENSVVGKSITSLDGKLTANKAFCDIVGYSEEELNNLHWKEITHPDDVEMNLKIVKSILDGEKDQYHWEKRYIHKDGQIVWTEIATTLQRDNEGNPAYFISEVIDITERKTAEIGLKESEEKFKSIVNSSPTGKYFYRLENNTQLILIGANPSADRIIGMSHQQLFGKTIEEAFPNLAETEIPELYKKVARKEIGHQTFEIQYQDDRFSGYYTVHVFSTQSNVITVDFVDISERKLMEFELIKAKEKAEESEERFQLAMKASNDGLFDWNLETNEIYYSPGWKKMLGYEDHEIQNDFSVWEITTNPDDVRKSWELQQKLITKQIDRFVFEFKMKHKDGHWVDILSRAEAFFNEEGKAIRIVGTHTDISERIRAEEEVTKTNKMLGLVMNSIPQFVFWKNRDSVLLGCNDNFAKVAGFNSPKEIVGKTDFDLAWNTEEAIHFRQYDEKVMKSGTGEYHIIETQRQANGKQAWLDTNKVPLFDNDGNVIGLLGTFEDITERKLAEEKLHKLSQTVEQSPASVVITNTQGYIEYVNPKFTEITGYTAEEAIGQTPRILKSGEQSADLYKELWSSISSGKEWIGELHNKKKNGKLYWEHVRISPIINKNGEITNYLAVKEDITDIKQAEMNFRHSIDQSPLGIRIVTLKGETVYANRAFLNIYDFASLDEYTLMPAKERYTPQSYKDHLERKEIRKEGNDVADYEISIRHKNGEIKHVKVGRKEVIWNKTKHIQVINQDITDQKNLYNELLIAKEKAEKSEDRIKSQNQDILFNNERLESLLKVSQFQTESVQELLDFALKQAVDLTKSKIGYIYFYNEDKRQFILNSWSKEVMKECAVASSQTVYDLDKTGCWGDAVRQRKPIIINDYQAINPIKKGTPEGHVKLEKFLTIPVIFDDRIVAVAGVGNKSTNYDDSDIRQLTLLMDSVWKMSERLILIKDLLAAKEKAEESDRLKSAFLANMSHEIRTPMNGILGFLDLLQEPDLEEETKNIYIDIMGKSGQRLLNTINNIIEISKIEAHQVKISKNQFCIVTLLKELTDFFQTEAEAKGIKLQAKLPEQALLITSDRTMLESVFTNLIKNALKFTQSGEIVVCLEQNNDHLTAYVSDTGVGIAPDKIEQLFERFIQAESTLTRRFEGSGLGLSITKEYVNLLNGKIWVESAVKKGSTFYVELPASELI